MTSAYNECPFQCGWTVTDAHNEDDARHALRVHLEVEHGAVPDRDEQAMDPANELRYLEWMKRQGLSDPPPFEFQDEREGN